MTLAHTRCTYMQHQGGQPGPGTQAGATPPPPDRTEVTFVALAPAHSSSLTPLVLLADTADIKGVSPPWGDGRGQGGGGATENLHSHTQGVAGAA
jgi:hypothetical protein